MTGKHISCQQVHDDSNLQVRVVRERLIEMSIHDALLHI